jgi:hypothetical protein
MKAIDNYYSGSDGGKRLLKQGSGFDQKSKKIPIMEF